LLDIQMPYMSGIDCLQQIRKLYPAIVVILLTSFDEEHYIIEGLARGARSYLLKTATFEYLDQYIRDAINGTFVMPSHIATKLAIFLQQSIDLSKKSLSPLFFQTYELTRTEQQIAKFLAKRLSNTEIAEQLGVQSGTIRNHLVTIFSKLHVQNRQEAILFIESHLI
jgi:DNA-binding NarL/FixJ family response regulator